MTEYQVKGKEVSRYGKYTKREDYIRAQITEKFGQELESAKQSGASGVDKGVPAGKGPGNQEEKVGSSEGESAEAGNRVTKQDVGAEDSSKHTELMALPGKAQVNFEVAPDPHN